MSNIDKLSSDVLKTIEVSSNLQKYRARVSNRKIHTFFGNTENFKASLLQGIRAQRTKSWLPTKKQDDEITSVIEEYFQKLYSILSAPSASKIFNYEIVAGTPKKFTAIIRGDGNIEGHLQLVRNKANLLKVSNVIKRLFGQDGSKIAVDLGHREGSTVAGQVASAMIERFESVGGNVPINTSALEKLKVLVKYNPLAIKLATIEVEDQFGLVNQSTTDEALISNLLKESLGENFIQKHMNSLIEPRVNNTINNLLDIAKKGGAKTSKKLKVDKARKTSKKTKSLDTKNGILSGRTIELPKAIKLPPEKVSAAQDWSSLRQIINSKLPQKVAANMGAPGLVYRTGTFANSTKVVNVENTKQGYPSIVFDYEREPYGVFDRRTGKAPWNTPSRDPRALVDRSVREIVREMAIGRFFTRRA
jgi:hypothetical protein